MKIRVYYEDTDAGGVVYYGNYLRYFERGRTELFREKGLDLGEWEKTGFVFTVSGVEAFYRYPARYNDLIDMETRLIDASHASLTFSHTIRNAEGRLLVEGTVKAVCVSIKTFKPTGMPPEVRRVTKLALEDGKAKEKSATR